MKDMSGHPKDIARSGLPSKPALSSIAVPAAQHGGSRPTPEDCALLFDGPVESDETFIGCLEENKHKSRKLNAGRGGVGKAVVAGVKDRETSQVVAKAIPDTTAKTLQGFVEDRTEGAVQVCTDGGRGCVGIDGAHESVNHGAGAHVRDMAHTNGVKPFWAALERSHKGTFHKFSRKHLRRRVDEFAGRHNARNADTVDQTGRTAASIDGKRLAYRTLRADNGLLSAARSSKKVERAPHVWRRARVSLQGDLTMTVRFKLPTEGDADDHRQRVAMH
ncbi:MAG: IS1595 family transposase [Boseongicola sp. SB0662_bin_57]|nr:IS1595 family transposase [Boseongicola sp. SB0662_bin_57]